MKPPHSRARRLGPRLLWLTLEALAAAGFFLASALLSSGLGNNADALWRVVHGLCVTDQHLAGAPWPCASVNARGGYVVVKVFTQPAHLLLVPTRRLVGIESPQLQAPGGRNYWQDAWNTRSAFDGLASGPPPRDDIGLAINSALGRSQNQLHIHVACVRPEVRRALKANEASLTPAWSVFPVRVLYHRYKAMRIDGAELGGRDPFKLLAAGDPYARAHMADETLVLVGAVFRGGKPGFVLFSDHADVNDGDQADGEKLLDHGCAVLRRGPGRTATG